MLTDDGFRMEHNLDLESTEHDQGGLILKFNSLLVVRTYYGCSWLEYQNLQINEARVKK